MATAHTMPRRKRVCVSRPRTSGRKSITRLGDGINIDDICESEESSDDEDAPLPPSRDDVDFNDNLAKFKKKRNCEWPLTLQEYDADPSLGEWVFRMRRRSLSRFQFNVLNNMNFFWKGPQSKGECSNDFHETMQGQNKDDQISQNEAAPPHRLKLKLGTRKRKGRRYQSRVKKQGQGPRLDGRCKKWNRNFEKLKRCFHC